MGAVQGLGYAIVHATDLPAWKEFAVDLLGLQTAEWNDDRLLLRMDEKSYRLDIRRTDEDRVAVLGWEVGGPTELEELAVTFEDAGFTVTREGSEVVRERLVSGLMSVDDPEGQRLEFFYGARTDQQRFASPLGARFVTGRGGLGHAFQMVDDNDAYRRFYVDLLGFRLSDHVELGPAGDGTFVHCNPRHHSFAWASVPDAPRGVAHLMFEVDDIDHVGRAWDKVQTGAAPIGFTFGRHSNDEMISFYAVSPSGFEIEYGYGGKLIDEATWTPDRYSVTSYWGHVSTNPLAVG